MGREIFFNYSLFANGLYDSSYPRVSGNQFTGQ